MKPKIAIIGSNSLMNIGLKTILERIIPMAEVCLFENADSLCANGDEAAYFHYFVATQAYAERSRFFREHRHKTIILSTSEQTMLPADMHILNISQSEDELVRAILRMHQGAHRGGYPAPNIERPEHTTPLSERECEVLRLVVKGLLNKDSRRTENQHQHRHHPSAQHHLQIGHALGFGTDHLCRNTRFGGDIAGR